MFSLSQVDPNGNLESMRSNIRAPRHQWGSKLFVHTMSQTSLQDHGLEVILTCLLLSGLSLLIRQFRRFKLQPSFPLPPGPRALPIVGNLLDLTVEQPWLKVTNWQRIYGVYRSFCSVEGSTLTLYSPRQHITSTIAATFYDRVG